MAAYDGSRFPISLDFLNYGIFIAGSPLFEELPYAIVCILLIVLLIKVMNILVTGSAGMIGGYVVKGLIEKGHTVIGVDRSGTGIYKE